MNYFYFAQATESESTINTTIPYEPPAEPAESSPPMILIGGGLLVGIVLVLVGVILLKKGKKAHKTNIKDQTEPSS